MEGGPESHVPADPFERLRTRTVIPWMIAGGLAFLAAFHAFALLTPLDAGNPQTTEVAFGIGLYVALAWWIVWACRRSGIGLRRLVGTIPARFDGSAWIALAGLLAVAMAFSYGSWSVFAYGLAVFAPGVLEFLIEALATEPDQTLGYRLAMAVIAVVVAPVVEEVFFRGILVNRWGRRWGMSTAVIASSVAFGILHANPVGIGIVGLVAALLYLRSGTLIVPIVFHGANNLIATVAESMSDVSVPLDIAAEVQAARDDVAIGVILVGFTLPVLVWYIRRGWPTPDAAIPYAGTGPAA